MNLGLAHPHSWRWAVLWCVSAIRIPVLLGVHQRDDLRAKFEGPRKKLFSCSHIAEEVREILATLGFSSLSEVTGRTDLLKQVSRGDAALDDLDLNPILVQADGNGAAGYVGGEGRVEVADTLDALMVSDAHNALENGGKMQLSYNIENTARAIGTRLSSHIVRRFGMIGLREVQITACLRGSAGQSLGAFAVQGLRLDVVGDANDYVGKGLSGGMITVRPGPQHGLLLIKTPSLGTQCFMGRHLACFWQMARLANAYVSAIPAQQLWLKVAGPMAVNI